MRIIFFGTPDFVIPVVETLKNHFEVICVVTSPDSIEGRKKILTPSPVKQYASEIAIPVINPEKLTTDVADDLASRKPDLFIVAAYGKIIPQVFLDIPLFGALNIHPSLLPQYRGPSPIQSALKNNDKESGISIIKMDEKMDHGPLVYQEIFPLKKTDTFASLHNDMFKKAAEVLPEVITKYTNGTLMPIEQNHEKATICSIIKKQDGYISMDALPNSEALDALIRAYYPWPTVHTIWKLPDGSEKMVKLLPEKKIQLEGKKPVNVSDLLNGYPEFKQYIEKLEWI